MERNGCYYRSTVESKKGLTLLELIISITIISIFALTASALFISSIDAYTEYQEENYLFRRAAYAMEIIVSNIRKSKFLLIPTGGLTPSNRNRDILAISAGIDNDGDGRIDEDVGEDMTSDGESGIILYDDNGNGLIDERNLKNDDEQGAVNEEQCNGVDDDGDGFIDEDLSADMNEDGFSGIYLFDDDDDGNIDEGIPADDDEDGNQDEDPPDPLIYYIDSNNNTLIEKKIDSITADVITREIASGVQGFNVSYQPLLQGEPLLVIKMQVKDKKGNVLNFFEQVYPRNLEEKDGERNR